MNYGTICSPTRSGGYKLPSASILPGIISAPGARSDFILGDPHTSSSEHKPIQRLDHLRPSSDNYLNVFHLT